MQLGLVAARILEELEMREAIAADRDQFAIKRIVDFYHSQPTDYADYFEAAWRYKHRVALGIVYSALAVVVGCRVTKSQCSPARLTIRATSSARR